MKKPSQSVIRLELTRKATKDPSLSEAVLAVIASPDEYPFHDRLLDWAATQTEAVEQIIMDFLDDPEARLQETLQALTSEGILLYELRIGPAAVKRVTYTSILKKNLPATKDELIEALSYCPINRPASTVRQFLRRHAPMLEMDAYNRYSWKQEEPISDTTIT